MNTDRQTQTTSEIKGPDYVEPQKPTGDSRKLKICGTDEHQLKDQLPTPEAITRALQSLYESLERTVHLDTALARLCEHAVELIAECDMAGVTLVDPDGNPYTPACSAPAVEKIDTLQYLSGSGPCLEATEDRDIVIANRAEAVYRWPGFSAEARRYGVNSFLSVPLPYLRPGSRSGAVNLYSKKCDGFRQSQVALLTLFATAASYAIMSEERYRDEHHHALHLEQALDSRAVIDQAKGVLMAVHSIDADAAFASLVETSQRSNKKLRIVAEELLAGLWQ